MSYPEAMSNRTNSEGSQTVYAVIDGKRVPLDRAAARRIAENAHLLERSLGTRRTKHGAENAQRALVRERRDQPVDIDERLDDPR
jgi:hypothetical protein